MRSQIVSAAAEPGRKQGIGLLVSVRNEVEAQLVVKQGVEIVDIKEPANGSLGRAEIANISRILQVVPAGRIVSCALGELGQLNQIAIPDFFRQCDPQCRIGFAKIGLAGAVRIGDWRSAWKKKIDEFPAHVKPVSVAYADHENANSPRIEAIIDTGNEIGCEMFLLDTCRKNCGGSLDLMSDQQIKRLVQLANSRGMKFVLAGSIKRTHGSIVHCIGPQFVGVRGAVCIGSKRTLKIDARALHKFVRQFAVGENCPDGTEIA